MNSKEQQHQERIVDQFSKQAIPFARLPGHLNALQILAEMSGARPGDELLDVACGPGLVVCEFAPRVQSAEGIDITGAMIAQARKRQQEAGLKNVSWRIGTVDPLPYGDARFSVVITRYSFHHFLQPRLVLAEMARVCRPGGRILVADVELPSEKAAAYDRMEKMRDPSHVRALTGGELDAWFAAAGLTECRQTGYAIEIELEAQLQASFPAPGDEARLREMIIADIGQDELGVHARRKDGKILLSYPVSVYVGTKPHGS